MEKLILVYIGPDTHRRPVYKANGKFYVDTDPRKGHEPKMYTKYRNDFDGEPDIPVSEDILLEFVPCRAVW